jgi:hypothetical protein
MPRLAVRCAIVEVPLMMAMNRPGCGGAALVDEKTLSWWWETSNKPPVAVGETSAAKEINGAAMRVASRPLKSNCALHEWAGLDTAKPGWPRRFLGVVLAFDSDNQASALLPDCAISSPP